MGGNINTVWNYLLILCLLPSSPLVLSILYSVDENLISISSKTKLISINVYMSASVMVLYINIYYFISSTFCIPDPTCLLFFYFLIRYHNFLIFKRGSITGFIISTLFKVVLCVYLQLVIISKDKCL